MEKLKIPYPIIVEGKYDKIKLDSILSANIIKTDGFGIFRREELASLLRQLARECGKIIVLTDSDGAGRVIRSHIRGILPPDSIIDLYIPDIPGKERRKTEASAAGLLGVEGMDAELLRSIFLPYAGDEMPGVKGNMTKLDFYEDGLSGKGGAEAKRAALCREFGLPRQMNAGALLAAVNMLKTREEYKAAILKINGEMTHGK